ncbi:MAG: ABC transporter ATP-binding protein [Candidatus Dormibacteria bacterium]
MTATVLEADGLGKRYRRKWALSECTLAIPSGKVVALVGPNGAGKTTLMHLAVGLLQPSAGSVAVLGGRPGTARNHLAGIGFVAQDAPTYPGLSVRDHLRFGEWMNSTWDAKLAEDRIDHLHLDPRQKAGQLSGGQRAQLALTLAVAKRPELLVLDEPVASLDPLARREFLQSLMEVVAEQGASVILASHLVADLERVCDYLVLLIGSRVQVAGDIDELLGTHRRLTGRRLGKDLPPSDQQVILQSHTDRQSTLVVRTAKPILDPAWSVDRLDLEDLVLAYMTRAVEQDRRPHLEVRS